MNGSHGGDDQGSILVTGATGTVGPHVVRQLRDRDVPVRVASRDPESAREQFPDCEAVRFDFADPVTYGPALGGVESVFLVRPGPVAAVEAEMFPFLDAMAAAGSRCVLLSVQGADRNPLLPHARLESGLRERGIPSTFLRAGFFMDNLHTFHRPEIWGRGEIWVPAGDAALAMVDARDVATVGVAALLDGSHAGAAYEPTGAERVTFDDVARVMTAELGREVRYVRPSFARFAWHARRRRGFDWRFVLVQCLLYALARLGIGTAPTDDVRRVTGEAPRDIADYVRVHRDAWL
jgi:uncharacterized protein YbjT (DUF2867 family)